MSPGASTLVRRLLAFLRIAADHEIVDGERVLIAGLYSERQPIVRRVRQFERDLCHRVVVPRDGGRHVDASVTVKDRAAIPGTGGDPALAVDHVASLDVE